MMNEYQYYCSGAWAHHNPTDCPCQGTGWLGSDLDTFHQCPIHYVGQIHPETDIYHLPEPPRLRGFRVYESGCPCINIGYFASARQAAYLAQHLTLKTGTSHAWQRIP